MAEGPFVKNVMKEPEILIIRTFDDERPRTGRVIKKTKGTWLQRRNNW
jgi:hypothetical protein